VLAITWPSDDPVVLRRDLDLPDFATLLRRYEAAAQAPAGVANAL
jgi:hypothetical protein